VSAIVLKNVRWAKNKKHRVGLSVGSLVLSLFRFSVLSQWFTFQFFYVVVCLLHLAVPKNYSRRCFFLWGFKAQMFDYPQMLLSCTKFQACTNAHKKKQWSVYNMLCKFLSFSLYSFITCFHLSITLLRIIILSSFATFSPSFLLKDRKLKLPAI